MSLPIQTAKKCSVCDSIKYLSEFGKQKRGFLGHRAMCKICLRNKDKEYYNKNIEERRQKGRDQYWKDPEAKKAYSKIHRENNKEYYSEKFKEWSSKNKEYLKIKSRNYSRKQTELKSNMYYATKIRNSVNRIFRKDNVNKKMSSDKLLGCPIFFVIGYLKDQGFKGGVHHIDHVIPLSKFDLKNANHLRIACNYRNLQPLTAMDNLKKGCKLPNEWKTILKKIGLEMNIETEDIEKYIEGVS